MFTCFPQVPLQDIAMFEPKLPVNRLFLFMETNERSEPLNTQLKIVKRLVDSSNTNGKDLWTDGIVGVNLPQLVCRC